MSITISASNHLTVVLDSSLAIAGNAAIITATGEVVKQIVLPLTATVIDVTDFVNKNYSIKVIQGTNVTVQKI